MHFVEKRVILHTWTDEARAATRHVHLHKAPYMPHFESERCWNSIPTATSCESISAKSQSKAFVHIQLENSAQSRLKFPRISLKRR